MEQSEEEELSSNIEMENIPHEVDIKEMKHHDCHCPSASQEVNSDTEAVSSSQALAELQGMGAVEKNLEELESVSGRCAPTVENTSAEHDVVGGQRPDGVNDHADMSLHVLDERPPQTKASTPPTKDRRQLVGTTDEKENFPAEQVITADKKEGRQAVGGITRDDKKEDLCASKPSQKTKRTTRRLLPVSSMMMKDFTGPNMDAGAADTKKAVDGGVGKASSGEAGDGREVGEVDSAAESTSGHQASLTTVTER